MKTPTNTPMQHPIPLDDIILPAPIQNWEMAYGWWLLIIIGGALIIGLALYLKSYLHKQNVIKQAQANLLAKTDYAQGNELCAAINEWLKIQARKHWPHAQALHGQAWVDFLNNSAQKPLFVGPYAQALADGPYLPRIWASRVDLQNLALQWFMESQAYRPVKKHKHAFLNRSAS